jgi:hypothetical protein
LRGQKINFARLNAHSNAALDGTGVLNVINTVFSLLANFESKLQGHGVAVTKILPLLIWWECLVDMLVRQNQTLGLYSLPGKSVKVMVAQQKCKESES